MAKSSQRKTSYPYRWCAGRWYIGDEFPKDSHIVDPTHRYGVMALKILITLWKCGPSSIDTLAQHNLSASETRQCLIQNLHRLCEAGKIRRVGVGIYAGMPIPPPVTVGKPLNYGPLRCAILAALEQSSRALTLKDIVERLPEALSTQDRFHLKNTVAQVLFRSLRVGDVQRVSRGHYTRPSASSSQPPVTFRYNADGIPVGVDHGARVRESLRRQMAGGPVFEGGPL